MDRWPMRDLELNKEYVYEIGSAHQHGRTVLRETVTFRVLGQTSFGYTIKFVTSRPRWLSYCDDFILRGSGMHMMAKVID
jgi:hypothetical protein